jgi:hypothetical protein
MCLYIFIKVSLAQEIFQKKNHLIKSFNFLLTQFLFFLFEIYHLVEQDIERAKLIWIFRFIELDVEKNISNSYGLFI